MTTPRPFGGTRRNESAERSRERLLRAGEEMVEETGLTVGLDHLRYETIIQRSGVARSVAYRLYPGKSEFYGDLLVRLVGPSWAGVAAFDAATIEVAMKAFVAHLPDMGTADGRWRAMLDACRVGAEQNFKTLAESSAWKTYVALNATALSMPDGELKERLVAALRDAEEGFVGKMADFYQLMSSLVGIRLRPEYGNDFRILAAAGAAVVEGLGLRNLVDPRLLERRFERVSGLGVVGSTIRDWSLPAIGFTAILASMVEFDPDWTPDALSGFNELAERPAGD